MANPRKTSLRTQNRRQRNRWIGIAAVAALLAVVVYVTVQETGSNGLSAEVVPDPALGPLSAPVQIVEYADFGCPACRAWHASGIRDQIVQTYGDQVRFVWKDFPVITPQSPQAAEAAHCVSAQGKFWEYHDLIYNEYTGLEREALRTYAQQVGVDLAAFDTCVDDRMMQAKVQANDQEARRLGLRGTPGFAVNGRPLPAPPSYEQLAALIEQELMKR